MESVPDSGERRSEVSLAPLSEAPRETKRKPAQWQHALVLEIIREAPDSVTLRLQLETATDFLPGQYYNVRLSAPGRTGPVQRAYSIGSSPIPDPSIIDLGVREMAGGMISPQLVALNVGDRIEVRGPVGRFTWTGDDGGPVLLIGSGSGVVPLMSMIRYAATARLETAIRLVCSSSRFDYAFYHRDLSELVERHSWLDVIHTFTRDPLDPRATHHRRIDKAMVADAVADQWPEHTYICGAPAMVENVQQWLDELGIDPDRVHTEKYD